MEELLDKIKDYINTRIRLVKLTLVEKVTLSIANLVTSGLAIIFLVFAVLFVSIALGFYISELLGNSFGGFFIVSLFYFILAVGIYLLKGKLDTPITNLMIKKILKEDEEEEISK